MALRGDTAGAPRAFRVAAVLCALLFCAAWANSLENSFHFDDDHVIERNLHLRDLRNIPSFFTDARTFSVFPQNATYRPLVSVTLAVDYAIAGGLNPVPFHVTQLLLFAGVGLLFFYVVRRLLEPSPLAGWAALFAATLFCVHTGNTQPGNYISARSELLCALGLLGAYAVYLRWPSLRRFGLFLIPMLLGALAKPPAVVFGAVLLLHKAIFEQELSPRTVLSREGPGRLGRALLETVPTLMAGALAFAFVEGMNPPGQSYGGGDRLQYLWTQAFVWLRYVGMFFFPAGLSADTDLTLLPTWRDGRVFAGVLVFAGSLALALWLTERKDMRAVALGVCWFWIGLLPTSVVPLAEVTNDHRPFLGFLGLCLAVAALAVRVLSLRPAWTRWAAALGAAVLVAHAVATHLRNRVWRDEASLWADTVEKSPRNGRAWMNFGLTQMRKGELQKAKALFERAAELVPNYAVLEINRGIVRGALQEPDAAAHFLRALQLAPGYAPAHYYYARYLAAHGEGPRAIAELQQAIAIDGGDPNPRHDLLALLFAKGDLDGVRALALDTLRVGADAQAMAYARGVPWLRASSDDADGWYALGLAFTNRQDHLNAAQAYRRALALDGRRADAWNNLGWSLQALGFVEEAKAAYQQGLRIDPTHAHMKNNLQLLEDRLAGRSAP
ncbi:MAG: tetratricopeptide repeat protein [Myxococcaceae bacterium]|nr:tetratricopeptide repeat protein [Myxococcaceae bacterium]